MPAKIVENKNIISFNIKTSYARKKFKENILIYNYAFELFSELRKISFYERMKKFPQLGFIKISSCFKKRREDYICMQIYLHEFVQGMSKNKSILRYSYGNKVSASDLKIDSDKYPFIKKSKVTIGDLIQILIIVTNIGHFRGTFTSSKALVIKACEDEKFRDMIINASDEDEYKDMAARIIDERDYYHVHVLNSYLVLDHLDQENKGVILGKEILKIYMDKGEREDKMEYIFNLFKAISVNVSMEM